MKIKSEITDKIIQTANTLVAEGIENPTNEQVRERMGKGSLSHISPVMREWRVSRQAEVAAALEMPSNLKRAIESALSQVWTSASQLATVKIDTIRQETDTEIHTATGERDEALSEITRLETRINELEALLTHKDDVLVKLQKTLQKARTDDAEQHTQIA